MLSKKNKQNFNVGIDIGTHTSRIIVVTQKDTKDSEIIAVSMCETKGVTKGYVTNPELVKETIQTLIKNVYAQSNLEIKKVRISINSVEVKSSIVTGDFQIARSDNTINSQDLDRCISEATKKLDLTNKEIIHTYQISHKIDGNEVFGRPIGMRGNKIQTQVVFVTCLSQHINDFVECFNDLEIEIEEIIASPIASAYVSLTENQKQNGVILVNIGADTVSMAVYEKNYLLALNISGAVGGNDFTKDIALGLKISFEEAEKLKIGKSITNYPENKLRSILEARMKDVFELIQKFLKKINREELLPSGIIITGGGSFLPQIESLARSHLSLASKAGIPEHLLQTKPRIRDASWLVVYGLALYEKDNSTNKIRTREYASSSKFFDKIKAFFHDIMP